MIIGGIVLLLPGACVGMFDLRWGQFMVIGAAAMIACGLVRITTRIGEHSRPGRKTFLIVASWGMLVVLILFSLHWVAAFNHIGHIRWQ